MRQVHVDEDLSGKTLTGPAQQSLFLRCNLKGTVFVGAWEGADYIGCTGAADWRQAQVYASYWRGGDISGSQYPADIGWLHHDPVADIIRQGLGAFSLAIQQAMEEVAAGVWHNYIGGSWRPSAEAAIPPMKEGKTLDDVESQTYAKAWRTLFQDYPNLARAFGALEKDIVAGQLVLPPTSLTSTILWPDGEKVQLDAQVLPSELSRYALARWAEGEVKPGHHAHVWTILPMRVQPLPAPDSWLKSRVGGY